MVHRTDNNNDKNRVSVLFAGGSRTDGVGIAPGPAKKYLRTPLPRIVRTSVTEESSLSSEEEDLSDSQGSEEIDRMGKDKNKVEHGGSNGDFTDTSMDSSYR